MKKVIIALIAIIALFTLNGCYKSRDELFTIPLVDSTFEYAEKEAIMFLGKQITNLKVTFIDTFETTDERSNYSENLFGDFSKVEIEVYAIEFVLEFDNTMHECTVVFMGEANPQRSNAYRTLVTIPDISDEGDTFNVIFDLDKDSENKNGLKTINIQIMDNVSSTEQSQDATFNITRQDI